jgi:hypothetical protein
MNEDVDSDTTDWIKHYNRQDTLRFFPAILPEDNEIFMRKIISYITDTLSGLFMMKESKNVGLFT